MALPSLFVGLFGSSRVYSRGVSKSAASSLDSLCRLQNVLGASLGSGSQRVTYHAANFMFLYICVGLLCHGMYAAVRKRRQGCA